MKPKSDSKTDNRIPGFDIWPPPPDPKGDKKKKADLPRNPSYREEKLHEGDQAVYDAEDTETETEKEKLEDQTKHDK